MGDEDEDYSELELEPGQMLVAHIALYRILREDGGMRDIILSVDGQGEELDLCTAVGMLAVAQHTLLCDTGGD